MGGEREEMVRREWFHRPWEGWGEAWEREGGVGERRKGREGTEFAGERKQQSCEARVVLGWTFRGQDGGPSQAQSSLESGVGSQKHLFWSGHLPLI